MHDILFKIFEMSIMGSIVILITILMRFLFRKSSKKYVMLLWAIVALRLLVPVSFESAVSVFNFIPHKLTKVSALSDESSVVAPSTTKVIPDVKKMEIVPAAIDTKVPVAKQETDVTSKATEVEVSNVKVSTEAQVVENVNSVEAIDSVEAVNVVDNSEVMVSKAETKKSISIGMVLGIVYGTGVAVITSYCVVNYILLKRKLKDAKEIEKNVFESEKVVSPFVFGLFAPKIYLPDVLDKYEREYILLHERTHIKHGDWISKFVGIAVVAVHWFNPLVWIGYSLFEQDVEMLCDEDTVSTMDKDVKKAYMMSIVSYAKKSRGKVYLVVPLSFSKPDFGKKEVTNRVKNMINYKKGTKITAILTTMVVFGVSTACAFNSTSKNETEKINSEETVAEETTAEEPEITIFQEDGVLEGNDFVEVSSDSRLYDMFMEKAAELHSEDEDDSLLYAFVDSNTFGTCEWKMLVYDKTEKLYTTYFYAVTDFYNDSIDANTPVSFALYKQNAIEPDGWMMTYDDFAAFPGITSYNQFGMFDPYVYSKDTYHEVPEDGEYQGVLHALSADFSTANIEYKPLMDCDNVVEKLDDLKVGDVIEFNGREVTVSGVYYDEEDEEYVCVDFDDSDPEHYIHITRGDFNGTTLIKAYDSENSYDTTLAELPIADDAVINLNLWGEIISLNIDTFWDFFEPYRNCDEDIYMIDDIGITFLSGGVPIDYYSHPLVIKDGKIVEITIEMNLWMPADYGDPALYLWDW